MYNYVIFENQYNGVVGFFKDYEEAEKWRKANNSTYRRYYIVEARELENEEEIEESA